jgi:hypothetical protein
MLEASRCCRILLPKCTSTKFAALGPDRDFFIAALAEVGKSHRNYYEISLRCKGSGPPVHAGGFPSPLPRGSRQPWNVLARPVLPSQAVFSADWTACVGLADNPLLPMTARPRFFGTDHPGRHC